VGWTVDVGSDVEAQTRFAIRELERMGDKALSIAHAAAREEVSTKTYQDRTGDLRANTEALQEIQGDDWTVHLDMGSSTIQYGIFVQNRGFSNFTQIGIGAGMDIDAMMRATGFRIANR
jgi:hypothetical protein